METIEEILDQCLDQIVSGESSMEECLVRYPFEAAQLEPLLAAAANLQQNLARKPLPEYRARARSQLLDYAHAHPRSKQSTPRILGSPGWRVAFSLVVLILVFVVSGTAYAQGSMPGDSFYGWKITSEHAWRTLSRDPIGIDLILAERRVSEYLLVSGDPDRSERALNGYGEVLVRLKSETDTTSRGRVVPILQVHEKSLRNSGVQIPELDELLGKQESSAGSDSALPANLPGVSLTPLPSP